MAREVITEGPGTDTGESSTGADDGLGVIEGRCGLIDAMELGSPSAFKTDLLVEIDGLSVGVSVTRAIDFPFEDPYTVMQAETLLIDKLGDVLVSTANVAPRDAWVKQILHVVAYVALPPEITADTLLVVTVTHGDDAFIY